MEALSPFSREDFDLVITDVRMPSLSGIELLRQIRKVVPDLPAIVITAFGDMETAMEAKREGGNMRIVTVYRVDYAKKIRVPIGWVEERRRKDRGDNLLGLIRLARKIYGRGTEDAIFIVVDSREARRAYMERLAG